VNPKIYAQYPGEAGIMQTIYQMRELVNKNFLHPWIRERAAKVIEPCNRRVDCEDRVLLSHVINAIQYVRDPQGVEALHDPVTFVEDRLRNRQRAFGDCDDMSIYLATLLKSIGHRPRFRVLSRFNDGHFHHILVFCHDKNLDATMEYGDEPKNPTRAIQVDI
jgi:hypothetical protein